MGYEGKVYQAPEGQWTWVIHGEGANIVHGDGYAMEDDARQGMVKVLQAQAYSPGGTAVGYATGGVPVESFTVDEEAQALLNRYAAGDMNRTQLYEAVLKLAEEGGEA